MRKLIMCTLVCVSASAFVFAMDEDTINVAGTVMKKIDLSKVAPYHDPVSGNISPVIGGDGYKRKATLPDPLLRTRWTTVLDKKDTEENGGSPRKVLGLKKSPKVARLNTSTLKDPEAKVTPAPDTITLDLLEEKDGGGS